MFNTNGSNGPMAVGHFMSARRCMHKTILGCRPSDDGRIPLTVYIHSKIKGDKS
jgi:hypothetical protein